MTEPVVSQDVLTYTYAGDGKKRLDIFLHEAVDEFSRSRLQTLIREGLVLVDGQARKASFLLTGGEEISLVNPAPTKPHRVFPEAIPLNIFYEDQSLLVLDKPAGLVVHPAAGNWDGTLVNALLHHCHDLAGIGGELRPGIVHRLDRDTSGVLVVAKDDFSHRHLSRQFKQHTIAREYVALVYGRIKQPKGSFASNLGRNPRDRKKMASVMRGGRRAVTHYEVLERLPATTFLRLKLETGRTHQIRVHLSEASHPLVGDQVYGKKGIERQYAGDAQLVFLRNFPRQVLHARLLGFVHPRSGEYLEFTASVPDDLEDLLRRLRRLDLDRN
ncbi:MAG: RluA family pseudouridine synthase [Pseudomonadota bacterium]|nr:RluA family pseudouridine synthase [Pseudomonadota bacterium]